MQRKRYRFFFSLFFFFQTLPSNETAALSSNVFLVLTCLELSLTKPLVVLGYGDACCGMSFRHAQPVAAASCADRS